MYKYSLFLISLLCTVCCNFNSIAQELDSTFKVIETVDTVSFCLINRIIKDCSLKSKRKVATYKNINILAQIIIAIKKENSKLNDQIFEMNKEILCLKDSIKLYHVECPVVLDICSMKDTSVFYNFSFPDLLIKQDTNRRKIKAISIVHSLLNENSKLDDSLSIKSLISMISFLENENIDWSFQQKIFVDKIIRNNKIYISYYEVITEEFNNIIKSNINYNVKNNLNELLIIYSKPLQQELINIKLKEIGL